MTLSSRYQLPARLTSVVAFDHFGDGDCPIAYEVFLDDAAIEMGMGKGGTLRLELGDDGSVRFDGTHDVAVGTRVKVGYEGADRTSGEYVIEARGAWPRSEVRATS